MKTKVTKTFNILLRILILIATYSLLYTKLTEDLKVAELAGACPGMLVRASLARLAQLAEASPRMLAEASLLMLVNWGLETAKWRFMTGKIEKVSFFRAIQAVFAGASISFFTPNRTGEYFGRAFILETASRMDGILITILGSMCQLLITIFTGSFALLIFIPTYFSSNPFFSGHIYHAIAVLTIIINIILLCLLINIRLVAVLCEKLFRTRMKKFRKHLAVFSLFRASDILRILLISLIRYIVFTLQFLILLRVFSVPVPVFDSVIIISLIFFVLSVIPTVTLTELGVRDSAAVYFFGLWFSRSGGMPHDALIGVLSAATLLWIINLAVPAVIGTFFIPRLNFFRKYPVQKP